MSVLEYVIDRMGLPAEPAATQALAYILKSNPEIAGAFVRMLQDSNIDFEPGRIEAEQEHGEARPDLTIQDNAGHVRVFVENKFWAGLTAAQPVDYLEELPEAPPSALLFIVPEQRLASVWNELKARCGEANPGWTEPPGGDSATWVRVGCRTMMIVSWGHLLERLLDVARSKGHDDLARDILQLQRLASREDVQAFLPLRADEVTNQEMARRLVNYIDLIYDIRQKLKDRGIIDTDGFAPGISRYANGIFFSFSVHKKLQTWFGIDLRVWREVGITPLWWTFDSKSGVRADHFKTNPELFRDVKDYGTVQYVPICLKAGAERDRVIEDAVEQMIRIAANLLEKIRND